MSVIDFNASPYRDRTMELADKIWNITEENFDRGPVAPERIGEALNALAYCAANIVKNCDRDPAIARFFYQAFAENLGDSPKIPEKES